MRRRDFLRAAFGAVAGLAVGVPVMPRTRPKNPGFTDVCVWPRKLTAEERRWLYNAGDGQTLDHFFGKSLWSRSFVVSKMPPSRYDNLEPES